MNKAFLDIQSVIINKLKQGIIPWERPWNTSKGGGAVSFVTGRPYSFLNSMLLEPGEYITWLGLQKYNGRLRKGARGNRIYLWKAIEKKEVNEKGEVEIKTIPYLRTFVVFSLDDCIGIKPRWQSETKNTTVSPISHADDVINRYLQREHIDLRHTDPNQAYYSVGRDYINIPSIHNFKTAEQYYSVLLHEATHSTGCPGRLSRYKINDHLAAYGSSDYSREELTAEMGAAFMLHRLCIDNAKTQQQSAAYIQGWLRRLSNDINMVVVAAGHAERAAKYIFGENYPNNETDGE